MTDDELHEALIWLFASDCGLTCSSDEVKLRHDSRQAIWERLVADEVQLRVWISRFVREMFLSEIALASGHGIDDVCEFWNWFDRTMWIQGCLDRRKQPAVAASGSTR